MCLLANYTYKSAHTDTRKINDKLISCHWIYMKILHKVSLSLSLFLFLSLSASNFSVSKLINLQLTLYTLLQ